MATRTPPAPTAKNSVTVAGKVVYLNNRELLAEVKRSKENKVMSALLAKMLMLLCSRFAKKGNFVNYSYNEDMQAYAMMMLVRTWDRFDPEKYDNPFAFYTQCIKNSFIQYLKNEKRERQARDVMMIDIGLSPSYSYDGGKRSDHIEDEQEFDTIRSQAEKLDAHAYTDRPIDRDNKGVEIEIVPVEVHNDDEIA